MSSFMSSIDTLAGSVMQRLDDLAEISESPDGLTRRYLTAEHASANQRVGEWMRQAGMTTRIDEAGNIIGRYESSEADAPTLLVGSHLDSIINAGRYDGMLGVVLPIQCLAAFHAQGRRFPYAIEVIGFGDEEGVRFQSTYLGSRAIAGTFDRTLLERQDGDNISLAQAMTDFGLDPQAIDQAAHDPSGIVAYVEVHIEQGPVLERLKLPVGVVTAIAGATRLEVEVQGLAGHAGTVPMIDRRDAMAATAEMILCVEQICTAEAELVGTVGKIEALPGAVNVIPGRVRFTIDLRSADDDQRHHAMHSIRATINTIAERRGVQTDINTTHDATSVPCSQTLMQALADAVEVCGFETAYLPSGAGHDAAAISTLCDIGMLFVRCEGGISHNPAESITVEDVASAARVLMAFLENFNDKE
jgi:allantoate deiminase